MFGSPSPSQGTNATSTIPPQQPFSGMENGSSKRKRRPAGTPDPDAEVVSLSPKTLLESDRYICEICNQGFQRDQNLQMHRRRHKVPWKLLKRETPEVRKRVFVCPEPSCLHHDPCHALGDLVGIKKHFRRKHSNHKQWVCDKCSKGYAVQSDYKAHLKTCGTRGHSCDCGRVFSRVESFIEHQDACNASRLRPELQTPQPACLSRTASSPSPSSETNFSAATWPAVAGIRLQQQKQAAATTAPIFLCSDRTGPPATPAAPPDAHHNHNLELQLLPSSNPQYPNTFFLSSTHPNSDETDATRLQLSIGTSTPSNSEADPNDSAKKSTAEELKDQAREQLRLAVAEKAFADEARQQAKRQMELAEQEFANAKRIRQHAQAELEKAQILKEHATKQINATLLQITCRACKQRFQSTPPPTAVLLPPDENSLVMSHMSSAVTTEGEGENNDRNRRFKMAQNERSLY